MNEQQAYAAADAAIARADALVHARVGRPQSDADFVNQWTADTEASEACAIAAKFGPESFRKQYRELSTFFAQMAV